MGHSRRARHLTASLAGGSRLSLADTVGNDAARFGHHAGIDVGAGVEK
jgi:hypothetical protein